MVETRPLTDKEKVFVKAWWNSDTFNEVQKKLEKNKHFKNDDEEVFIRNLRAYASQCRKKGIALKYFRGQGRKKQQVDKREMEAFVTRECRVGLEEVRDAVKETQRRVRKIQETGERSAAAAKKVVRNIKRRQKRKAKK